MLLRSESKLPTWWVVLMEALVAGPPSGSRPSSSHRYVPPEPQLSEGDRSREEPPWKTGGLILPSGLSSVTRLTQCVLPGRGRPADRAGRAQLLLALLHRHNVKASDQNTQHASELAPPHHRI